MVVSDKQVAIITGAGSGFGLGVAQALAGRSGKQDWDLRLVDMNQERGTAACKAINDDIGWRGGGASATFYQADCTDYAAMAAVFEAVFASTGRLDFVHANAGIAGKPDFFTRHDNDGGKAPDLPDMLPLKVNTESVCTTSYLALHFFRQTPAELRPRGHQSLVITASTAGLYPSSYLPLYTASKHGALGFMRAIAPAFWHADGIRVNAVCPGPVVTNLLSPEVWAGIPEQGRSTVDKIVSVVIMLLDGKEDPEKQQQQRPPRIDGTGGCIGAYWNREGDIFWGNAVEVSEQTHYFRGVPQFCHENTASCMLLSEDTLKNVA